MESSSEAPPQRGQGIADFVGHSSSEPDNGSLPFAGLYPFLHFLELCDVLEDYHMPALAVVSGPKFRDCELKVNLLPIDFFHCQVRVLSSAVLLQFFRDHGKDFAQG